MFNQEVFFRVYSFIGELVNFQWIYTHIYMTQISLSMPRRLTLIYTFRLLWIFSFRNHFSIPLFPWNGMCRPGLACAACEGWSGSMHNAESILLVFSHMTLYHIQHICWRRIWYHVGKSMDSVDQRTSTSIVNINWKRKPLQKGRHFNYLTSITKQNPNCLIPWDKRHSSFANRLTVHVEKQPVAWKVCCVEYWWEKTRKFLSRWTGLRDMTENV